MSLAFAQTTPFWSSRHTLPEAPPLAADTEAEVCVVGAGIAGLTTAVLLAREGADVLVLDASRPGSGESSRTTAHLATALDDRYSGLIRRHGREKALLAAQSHHAAVGRIERFIEELDLRCDYRRLNGYLFAAEPGHEPRLDEELRAARASGLVDVDFCDWPLGDGPRCLRFPRQAQFSPWPYLQGLARELIRLGGRLHGGSRVTAVREGKATGVETGGGPRVRAGAVVVTTNSPINDRFTLHTKLAPYRSYALALKIPAGSVPAGLYWDTAEPYHYARLTPAPDDGGEVLIVGGEDHKTGRDPDGAAGAFGALERWTRGHFPSAGEVTHRWSGQVMETIDGLAYIGRNPGSPDNIYVATGDSGMGMTHGTLASIIITDLIRGRPNPWAPLYDPSRLSLADAPAYAKENLNVARRYFDWIRPDKVDDGSAPLPGEGCVVQRGVHKVAVYRDLKGEVHERSAVCPHLGCIVAWNPVEHTWDCPCHGSRFQAGGGVLRAPAVSGLAPAAARENAGAVHPPTLTSGNLPRGRW